MHGISSDEAFAAALIWCVGALASLATTLRDDSYSSPWRIAGAMGCGGFVAICVVGILGASYPSMVAGGIPTLACASMAGLLGKSSDQTIRILFGMAFKLRLPPNTEDEKADK